MLESQQCLFFSFQNQYCCSLAVPVLPVMPVVPAGQACPVFAVLLAFKYTQLTLYPVLSIVIQIHTVGLWASRVHLYRWY